MREAAKRLALAVATIAVLPRLACFRVASLVLGRDRAFQGATQSLASIPGLRGQYLRCAFLMRVLPECHPTVTVSYGTIFSKSAARLGARVYIGPSCHVGLVHIGDDVLLAAGVHVPSGAHTHGTGRLDVPISEQEIRAEAVSIGRGTWVGSAAVVMADVGSDCVVGAGSVVTRPIPDQTIAAGVPAKVIRSRALATT